MRRALFLAASDPQPTKSTALYRFSFLLAAVLQCNKKVTKKHGTSLGIEKEEIAIYHMQLELK